MRRFLFSALLPLAEAVALNFTLPLFATAGAALFLAERVGPRRWGATFVGFIGMLIIGAVAFFMARGDTMGADQRAAGRAFLAD